MRVGPMTSEMRHWRGLLRGLISADSRRTSGHVYQPKPARNGFSRPTLQHIGSDCRITGGRPDCHAVRAWSLSSMIGIRPRPLEACWPRPKAIERTNRSAGFLTCFAIARKQRASVWHDMTTTIAPCASAARRRGRGQVTRWYRPNHRDAS